MTPPASVATMPHAACPTDARGCVREVLDREGMAWAIPAWDCIITAESGYDPEALNLDSNGYYSRGLAQINDQWHAWRWAGRDWRNPEDNIEVAIDIWWAAGGSWSSWSTKEGCGL